MANAARDSNRIPVIIGVSSTDGTTPVMPYVDPTTHRLYVTSALSGSAISAHIQTDTFTSTNNQTTFNSSQTVISTLGFYVNGSLQTPSTDYTTTASAAVLNSGIPAGCAVVWVYIF